MVKCLKNKNLFVIASTKDLLFTFNFLLSHSFQSNNPSKGLFKHTTHFKKYVRIGITMTFDFLYISLQLSSKIKFNHLLRWD